jgi:hypothetical protein
MDYNIFTNPTGQKFNYLSAAQQNPINYLTGTNAPLQTLTPTQADKYKKEANPNYLGLGVGYRKNPVANAVNEMLGSPISGAFLSGNPFSMAGTALSNVGANSAADLFNGLSGVSPTGALIKGAGSLASSLGLNSAGSTLSSLGGGQGFASRLLSSLF